MFACAQLATGRLVIGPYLARRKMEDRYKRKRKEENHKSRQSEGKPERKRERVGNKKGKGKHSTERENRPACLAAQPPHDFDLRNR